MIRAESLPRVPSLDGILPASLPNSLQTLLTEAGERALGLRPLRDLYERARTAADGASFFTRILEELEVKYDVSDVDLSRIPRTGPVIVVANHPFGAIEGIVLGEMLRKVRPDVKLMANYLLGGIPELREQMIPVDPFGGDRAAQANFRPLKETIRWVRDGGMLAMFPAGEVSSFNLRAGSVTDRDWYPTLARLIAVTGATVVPVYFKGANRFAFQLLGMIHPRLRTMLLPRELMNKRGARLEIAVGKPVPAGRLNSFPSDEDVVSYLRLRTYTLSHRRAETERPEPATIRGEIYPAPVVPPVPAVRMTRELDTLPPDQRLSGTGDYEVWYADARQIPSILREIGRLREVTFRAVGEGTGGAIDLDRFDADYFHLFVWNRVRHEVVGAYRLGRVDDILERFGKRGLYTATLFKFSTSFLEGLGKALEMGRAFVRHEYQRSYTPLLLLWKGIGEYVARNPEYRVLFGPISISSEYNSVSRQLMVKFLQMNVSVPGVGRHVRPRSPFRIGLDDRTAATIAGTMDDLAWSVSDIEGNEREIPVLLRQYLRLGARILGFNVDSAFGDVVDGLIMVDLTCTDRTTLARYMGKENAAAFLALHGREAGQKVNAAA